MKTCHWNPLCIMFTAGLALTPIAGMCADPAPQVRVSYADLNLSNPQGITMLYARLQRAAAEVCGTEPPYRELSRHPAWSGCVRTALDDAVAQVHSMGLAALHEKHVGRRSPLVAATGASEDR
jgi:UrcA family protein